MLPEKLFKELVEKKYKLSRADMRNFEAKAK
jgi:hypothetical protein